MSWTHDVQHIDYFRSSSCLSKGSTRKRPALCGYRFSTLVVAVKFSTLSLPCMNITQQSNQQQIHLQFRIYTETALALNCSRFQDRTQMTEGTAAAQANIFKDKGQGGIAKWSHENTSPLWKGRLQKQSCRRAACNRNAL